MWRPWLELGRLWAVVGPHLRFCLICRHHTSHCKNWACPFSCNDKWLSAVTAVRVKLRPRWAVGQPTSRWRSRCCRCLQPVRCSTLSTQTLSRWRWRLTPHIQPADQGASCRWAGQIWWWCRWDPSCRHLARQQQEENELQSMSDESSDYCGEENESTSSFPSRVSENKAGLTLSFSAETRHRANLIRQSALWISFTPNLQEGDSSSVITESSDTWKLTWEWPSDTYKQLKSDRNIHLWPSVMTSQYGVGPVNPSSLDPWHSHTKQGFTSWSHDTLEKCQCFPERSSEAGASQLDFLCGAHKHDSELGSSRYSERNCDVAASRPRMKSEFSLT